MPTPPLPTTPDVSPVLGPPPSKGSPSPTAFSPHPTARAGGPQGRTGTAASGAPGGTATTGDDGPGPLGRLGRWAVVHRGRVGLAWLLVAAVFAVFAPGVESALSGAGWQASGSASVQVRHLAREDFGGDASSAIDVVVSARQPITSPAVQTVIAHAEHILAADPRIGRVVPPQPGVSVSPNGRTGIILGGANAGPNAMVRAADSLQGPLASLSGHGITVAATGASVLWSDFNTANRSAMLRSELYSWPVTLAILVLAFGTLIAAGLPLLLAIVGLLSAAGLLDLLTRLAPISIWAMNFALMFALALGIDYALFVVVRFRGAHFGAHRPVAESVAQTMDTAGKAVLFSGLTVLVSLSTVLIVPSPAFRSMALGIMAAVVFILAATVTLLPAALGTLGDRIDALPLPWVHAGEHRSARFARWGERLWRHPYASGATALVVLLALASPVLGLRTSMPSITVVPPSSSARIGYDLVVKAFGPGAPGELQVITVPAHLAETETVLAHQAGIARVLPVVHATSASLDMVSVVPTMDPSSTAMDTTIAQLRDRLPGDTLVGGAPAENYDLQTVLGSKTPEVIALVLLFGFVLLVIALQAPLIAAIGVLTNLLATGAAFGVGRLVFQDGLGHGLLGFTPQGFLDAWGPIFFFAMIFAISMDYTVFLLSSAKEHWERSGDAKDAMVSGLAHSGRVIFSAAAVMVAVFFTFALSGPLPPKEMGVILGVAVLLDAGLVRLILLPVLLRLTGRSAWACPRWLRAVLPRISFSHS